AARQGQADLCAAAAEVQLERDQGQSLSFDGPDEPTNLALVKQQLSCARRLVIYVTSAAIGLDVRIQQPQLPVAHDPVGVGNVGVSIPKGLHLGARQHESG